MRAFNQGLHRNTLSRIILVLAIITLGAGCGPEIPEPVPTALPAAAVPTRAREAATETTISPTQEPSRAAEVTDQTEPIRVILFIGDGMGEEHRKAAAWMGYGKDGQLVMDSLAVHGSLSTTAFGNLITDSAAAATAMASGVRTRNGMIGLNPDGEEVASVLDHAREIGLAVGLVTNTQLPHATPAAFAAHTENRWDMNGIAPQLLETGVDVLLGGGEDFFLPAGEQGCHPGMGTRKDDRDLIAEAQKSGYRAICRTEELAALDTSAVSRLLGIFADEGMPRPFSPSLSEMTRAALEILSRDPEGFFLVVEAGQIDWASHGNNAHNAIQDTLALDEAVQIAREFVEDHPATLLIVAADHETGGLDAHSQPTGQAGEDGPFTGPDDFVFYVTWGSDKHTNADVPVTAQGPGAELLKGANDNTQIFRAVMSVLTGEDSAADTSP